MIRLLLALAAFACFTASADASDDDYENLGRAGWGARVVPVPLEVQVERDLLPGEGGLVVRVRPGGTADHLGIRPGDIVLTINDHPIATRRDIRDLLATVKPGDEAKVVALGGDRRARQLSGDFKPRLPRPSGALPWGGQPRDPAANALRRSPEEIIAAQRERLVTEHALLAQARRDLAQARARLPATPAAWYMHVAIAVGADADPTPAP